jgi:regulator of PEP synthase PpsR (kinase-PPPase family)
LIPNASSTRLEISSIEACVVLSTTHASIEEISSRVLEHLGINREMY